MIAEFNKHWEEEYKIKTAASLQSVIDKRNARTEKNVKTVRDRNTSVDMEEVGVSGDVVKQTEGDKYVTSSLVLAFIHTYMKRLAEDGSIKQTVTWFGPGNPRREFPVTVCLGF